MKGFKGHGYKNLINSYSSVWCIDDLFLVKSNNWQEVLHGGDFDTEQNIS